MTGSGQDEGAVTEVGVRGREVILPTPPGERERGRGREGEKERESVTVEMKHGCRDG